MKRALVFAAALAASCSATHNPERGALAPVARAPKPEGAAQPTAPAPPEAAAQAPQIGAAAQPGDAASEEADAVRAQLEKRIEEHLGNQRMEKGPKDPAARGELALGRIGGVALEARDFLRRLWISDNATTRDVLEQMVFARMATLEADRLGMLLAEAAVDAEFARAIAALEKNLADKGSKLTLDEHIARVLGVDPKLYRANLRADAIVQMLAERCVRAWMMENERALVRITEVRDAEALLQAKAALEAGQSFDAIALASGRGEDEATHVTRMTIARAESQELARLAFATPVGAVGGPLEQSGRWLYLCVDQRLEALSGGWAKLREPVEQSLLAERVANAEFLQWRAAMTRRYQVDLEPFFQIVEKSTP